MFRCEHSNVRSGCRVSFRVCLIWLVVHGLVEVQVQLREKVAVKPDMALRPLDQLAPHPARVGQILAPAYGIELVFPKRHDTSDGDDGTVLDAVTEDVSAWVRSPRDSHNPYLSRRDA